LNEGEICGAVAAARPAPGFAVLNPGLRSRLITYPAVDGHVVAPTVRGVNFDNAAVGPAGILPRIVHAIIIDVVGRGRSRNTEQGDRAQHRRYERALHGNAPLYERRRCMNAADGGAVPGVQAACSFGHVAGAPRFT